MSDEVKAEPEMEMPEPTGVITMRIERLEDVTYIAGNGAKGGYQVAHFHIEDEPKQVIVRRAKFEEGDKAVYVPNGSVLPDEPEFSNLGARRRNLQARPLGEHRSDGILISYSDVAYIMSRRAARMAMNDEEVALLTGKDAEYLYDAALAALYEIPLGVDIGDGLGIYPWVDPEEEVTVQIPLRAAIALGMVEPGQEQKEHCPLRLAGVPGHEGEHMPCDRGDFSRDNDMKENA